MCTLCKRKSTGPSGPDNSVYLIRCLLRPIVCNRSSLTKRKKHGLPKTVISVVNKKLFDLVNKSCDPRVILPDSLGKSFIIMSPVESL